MEPLHKGGKGGKASLFLALSRTPHALIDLATPATAAALWLGTPPPIWVIAIGVLTAFSGYTAVYALNDIVDQRTDSERMQLHGVTRTVDDLDALMIRHPLASGMLNPKEALLWTAGWAFLAALGSLLLNPVCTIIFFVAAALEVVYCLMLRASHLRSAVNGLVKTAGGLAAVFAVDPHPSALYIASLFLWIFFWEIGGQNVPHDWVDLDEDKGIGAKTIPLVWGLRNSSVLIMVCLCVSTLFGGLTALLSNSKLGGPFWAGFSASSVGLIIIPSLQLAHSLDAKGASRLFNHASYYPLAVLISWVVDWVV